MSKLARILIVDDNARCMEFMTLAFLARGGVEVIGETKPMQAAERIRTEKPDLVVLDVKMPELDGFGVLSLLRAQGNPVPVVMCSGSAVQKDIDRAYLGGCSGYLEKPTTLQDYRAMAGTIIDYWSKSGLPGH